jgi:hypothetical protein
VKKTLKRKWEDNIKINLWGIGFEDGNWIELGKEYVK